MINYLIELTIIHCLLTLGYWMFLKTENQYAKMRTYLILSTLLALIIPALDFSAALMLFRSPETGVTPEVFSYILMPVNFNADSGATGPAFGYAAFFWIYGIVSLWLLGKLTASIVRLIRLERKSEYARLEDIYIRKVANLSSSFTFFNWIFVNKNIETSPAEYVPIIRHELAHARLGHSYDRLLFEVFRALFWFLPGAWFVNKEIKKIHEYQADAYAVKAYDPDRYSSILISSVLRSNGLSVASSFHDGLILKRLKAMKQNVKRINPWKLNMLGMLCILLVIAFACNEQLDEDLKEISQNAYQAEMPESTRRILADLKAENPGQEYKYVEILMEEGEGGETLGRKISDMDIDGRLIAAVDVHKQAGTVGLLLKEGLALDYAAEKAKLSAPDTEGVYTIVEDQPEYPGGMEAFYRRIGDNMTYPLVAREAGVEGRVYVQFIVDKDGSLTDLKVLKAPAAEPAVTEALSTAAISVLTGMDNFTPGKHKGEPVKVRMVLPIIFELPDRPADASSSGTKTSEETMEEVVVVGYQ